MDAPSLYRKTHTRGKRKAGAEQSLIGLKCTSANAFAHFNVKDFRYSLMSGLSSSALS